MFAILAFSKAELWTISLVGIFFVLFPLLAHGLIGFGAGVAFGEKGENRREDGNWRRPKAQD